MSNGICFLEGSGLQFSSLFGYSGLHFWISSDTGIVLCYVGEIQLKAQKI